jgi:hypothetical protein
LRISSVRLVDIRTPDANDLAAAREVVSAKRTIAPRGAREAILSHAAKRTSSSSSPPGASEKTFVSDMRARRYWLAGIHDQALALAVREYGRCICEIPTAIVRPPSAMHFNTCLRQKTVRRPLQWRRHGR